MKHIYLIRHGETAKNRSRIHQGPDEPLTARGREQVRQVIALLQDRDIDTLVSSNYVRARETADMIADELGLPYTVLPAVREFGRPLALYGRHHYSFDSLRYIFDLYRHRMDLMWNREGAENLAHVRARIGEARAALETLPGERIAVVSHRIFMSMFTETVCADKPLSLLTFFFALVRRKQIPNTGVLHLSCDVQPETGKYTWRLEETMFPAYTR